MMPRFHRGQQLTAASLQMLVSRVQRLQRRCSASGSHPSAAPRCSFPRMRPAFTVAVRHGVLYYLQGFVESAGGALFPVGEPGYNALEADIRSSCDIWLDITCSSGSVTAAEVHAAPREAQAVSTRTHVRLAYIDIAEDGETLMAVQLVGGLISPWVPVMARGTCTRLLTGEEELNYLAEGDSEHYGRHDCCTAPHTAGALAGSGYTEGGRQYRTEFTLGYHGQLAAWSISEPYGNATRYFEFCSPERY